MKKQRSISQMKEQKKTLEKEMRNLPDAEFKTLAITMFNKLRGSVDEIIENFNKEIGQIKTKTEHIKKNQSEMKKQ